MQLPVPLEVVKAHLRVIDDEENDLILAYINAAIVYAEQFQRRVYYNPTDDPTITTEPMGELEKQALLLIVAHYYDNRALIVSGNTIVSELPMGANTLLSFRRRINV